LGTIQKQGPLLNGASSGLDVASVWMLPRFPRRGGASWRLGVEKAPIFQSVTDKDLSLVQSQSDVYQTTDKDLPLNPIFFVCALASNKFVCLASKQGFS